MNAANFLRTNLKWQFCQNPFDNLLCPTTDKTQLTKQLQTLANHYYPEKQKINTLYTEFCLNKIALSRHTTHCQQLLWQQFDGMWTTFCKLKKQFDKTYMYFPANGNGTRIQQIAELVTKCTQLNMSKEQTQSLTEKIHETFDLDERETQHLDAVFELYKINHFCALYATQNNVAVAKVLQPKLYTEEMQPNAKYRQAVYRCGKLSAVTNCFGNSALSYGQQDLNHKQSVNLYSNGRNVFDTFTHSRLGTNTANFKAQTKTIATQMQYFLTDFCQVKRFCVTNLGKSKRKLTVEVQLNHAEQTMFVSDTYTTIDNDVYVATAVVCDNQKVNCLVQDSSLTFDVFIDSNKSYAFDVVTIVSHNATILSREIDKLYNFGQTRCPYLHDTPNKEIATNTTIHDIGSCSNQPRRDKPLPSEKRHYTYQLGNCDVGTFVDNVGNSTTLLGGFAFNTGETVFALNKGKLQQINCGQFTLDGQTLVYSKDDCTCKVTHDSAKTYCVTYTQPTKTLFYFPFETPCCVTKNANVFTFCNQLRKFRVTVEGQIDSFTTNAIECNPERLRYKLSNDEQCGTCLAICVGKSLQTKLTIANCNVTPQQRPLLRESLVSTYLNYVNTKNLFCLNNYLQPQDPLDIAALCYTNPTFVKNLLQNNTNGTYNYYKDGKLTTQCNKLTFALAAVYYKTLVDGDFPDNDTCKQIQQYLVDTTFAARDVATAALALKKALQHKAFDKVACSVQYAKLKKIICQDTTLYAYAQAIGAVPLINPSKQRLKDLCNKLNVSRAWYYVSQIENLYGMRLVNGQLSFCPRVSDDNVLEQLSVNVDNKRINTTFCRASVQSMTLNGVTHFQPFRPSGLQQSDNTLVVTY